MAAVAVLGASLMASHQTYAREMPAQCVIKGGSDLSVQQYSGTCLFSQGEKGSFMIRKSDSEIIPSIMNISVYVLSPGVAEVRGLTKHGINSRWGPAKRSQEDPACWTGADFEICAY